MTDWFTSDTHFGYANIIAYCNRPFSSVEEMNEGMIERWNARVQPEDTVYHLGDFALGPRGLWSSYRERLNGKIVLIAGNHDPEPKKFLKPDDICTLSTVYAGPNGELVHLAHAPDNDERYGRPEAPVQVTHKFCGHVHDAWAVNYKTGIINVGVDVRDFEPKLLSELI